MITKKYYKLIRVSYEDEQYLTITNTSLESGDFKVVKEGTPSSRNLEYSVNGVDWTTYDLDSLPTVNVPSGGHIYLRGTNTGGFGTPYNDQYRFNFSVQHDISGNLFSLRNPDKNVFNAITTCLEGEFGGLFYGDTHLVNSKNLATTTITSVGNSGTRYMFNGCSSLISVPDFTSLTSVGDNGFSNTFADCTSLNSVPDLSSLTTVGEYGFQGTFSGCTSLNAVPDFSSLTNADNFGFQSTFMLCTSLNNVPNFGSITNGHAFTYTFYGCTSLTRTPDFKNITTIYNGSYESVFAGCTNLVTVYAPNVSTWPSYAFRNWLSNAGTSATGTKTAYVPAGVSIPETVGGIPSGWTRVDY